MCIHINRNKRERSTSKLKTAQPHTEKKIPKIHTHTQSEKKDKR